MANEDQTIDETLDSIWAEPKKELPVPTPEEVLVQLNPAQSLKDVAIEPPELPMLETEKSEMPPPPEPESLLGDIAAEFADAQEAEVADANPIDSDLDLTVAQDEVRAPIDPSLTGDEYDRKIVEIGRDSGLPEEYLNSSPRELDEDLATPVDAAGDANGEGEDSSTSSTAQSLSRADTPVGASNSEFPFLLIGTLIGLALLGWLAWLFLRKRNVVEDTVESLDDLSHQGTTGPPHFHPDDSVSALHQQTEAVEAVESEITEYEADDLIDPHYDPFETPEPEQPAEASEPAQRVRYDQPEAEGTTAPEWTMWNKDPDADAEADPAGEAQPAAADPADWTSWNKGDEEADAAQTADENEPAEEFASDEPVTVVPASEDSNPLPEFPVESVVLEATELPPDTPVSYDAVQPIQQQPEWNEAWSDPGQVGAVGAAGAAAGMAASFAASDVPPEGLEAGQFANEAEFAQLKTELEMATTTRDEISVQRDQLQTRVNELEQQAYEQYNTRDGLMAQCAEAQGAYDTLRVEYDQLRASTENAAEANRVSEAQLEQHERERAELLAERERFDADRERFDADRVQFDADRVQFDADREQSDADREQSNADRERSAAERQELAIERDRLEEERRDLVNDRERSGHERNDLITDRERLESERLDLAEERERLAAERRDLAEDRERLEAERPEPAGDHEGLEAERADIANDRERLNEERRDLTGDRERFEQERGDLTADRERLEQERNDLVGDRERLEEERREFATSHEQIESDRQQLEAERQAVSASQEQLESERRQLEEERHGILAEREQYAVEQGEMAEERQRLETTLREAAEERERWSVEQAGLHAEKDSLMQQLSLAASHESAVSDLSDELAGVRREFASAEQQRSDLQLELDKLVSASHEAEAATIEKDETIYRITMEKDDFAAQLEEAEGRKSELEEEVAQIRDELKSAAGSADERNAELVSQLQSSQQRAVGLESTLRENEAELAIALSAIEDSKASLAEFEQERELRASLESSLANLKTRAEQAEQEVSAALASAEKERTDSLAEAVELRSENESLQAKVAAIEEQLATAEVKARTIVEASAQQTEERLARLAKERDTAIRAWGAAEQRSTEIQVELRDHQSELDALRDQHQSLVEQMEASQTYRFRVDRMIPASDSGMLPQDGAEVQSLRQALENTRRERDEALRQVEDAYSQPEIPSNENGNGIGYGHEPAEPLFESAPSAVSVAPIESSQDEAERLRRELQFARRKAEELQRSHDLMAAELHGDEIEPEMFEPTQAVESPVEFAVEVADERDDEELAAKDATINELRGFVAELQAQSAEREDSLRSEFATGIAALQQQMAGLLEKKSAPARRKRSTPAKATKKASRKKKVAAKKKPTKKVKAKPAAKKKTTKRTTTKKTTRKSSARRSK